MDAMLFPLVFDLQLLVESQFDVQPFTKMGVSNLCAWFDMYVCMYSAF